MELKAYAKVNLILDVLSRREDGYHNIDSLFQSISLYDTVRLDFVPGKKTEINLSVDGYPELENEKNLAYRAVVAFLNEAKLQGRVSVGIKKRIPMQAGLGGGSADCSAVLNGLNTLCGMPFTLEKLSQIGATLGADVPFCIYNGTKRISGIGETVHPFPSMPKCYFVIAKSKQGVNTGSAYAELDALHQNYAVPEKAVNYNPVRHAFQNGEIPAEAFYNVFEEVILPKHPEICELKNKLTKNGATVALMSGSGSAVFGIFTERDRAEKTAELFRQDGDFSFVAEPIDCVN